jgi:hypothetical protein
MITVDTAVRIGTERTRRAGWRIRAAVALGLVAALLGGAPAALATTPAASLPVASTSAAVATGPGNQTDPHVSGSLVTWTDISGTESRIGYADLATGTTGFIPNAGHRDSLSGVDGDLIAFRRVYTDTTPGRPVMIFDRALPGAAPRELAPEPGARRAFPAIGGTTVAFMQFVAASSTVSEICVADAAVPDAPAVCLTNDGLSNRDPAVSPDGNTVTWAKCQADGTGCDVYVVRRGTGGWGTVTQLTDSTGEDILPATDGEIVTYTSNAGGDYDIWWEDVDGSDEHQLVLPDAPGSIEGNSNISRGALTFERELPGSTNADLYLYRPAGNVLSRLTATPDVDETLNAIWLSASDELRVAWASPDGLSPGHNDIHALRAELGTPAGPVYAACLLYDPAKAHRLGSTAPLKVRVCDATGANLSAPGLLLTAVGVVRIDGSATTALAESAGNANPDSAFRYDADLAGYVFNLSTKGLSRGTWELRFTVAGSPTVHALRFDVR